MSTETLLALIVFATVGTGTPGPNNLMVMASGANFGLRRTLPHILGIALGFAAMIMLVGLGLGRLFEAWPWLSPTLLAVSAVYLLYLAWKIATAAPPEPGHPGGRPFSFLQAAAFQWVNPKAWAMALTTTAVYLPGGEFVLASAIFASAAIPLTALWTVAGEGIGRFLGTPFRLRLFNGVMAALLLISTLPAML
ncbi:LysE family translocator [Palleronia abyssalis]|uniref:Cysteine/O-acetylserine efflux protein n=1 Tax=Palleronia abyssalis TaxID=1501240 RepID=A0A2R8BVV2_9RHOB|nr:LysE family translocator [Palleronia abyssalis]SPJ24279.1 Cysteine/O-acetylserine efflux protein [Palleronia abyssalis]